MSRVVWRGEAVLKKFEQKAAASLAEVGQFLVDDIKENFGSGAPGEHSKPGEPPFVQTGNLHDTIAFKVEDEKVLKVGSTMQATEGNKSYAWWLEMGSGIMQARPYLRAALIRNKEAILKMLGKNG